MVRRLIIAGVLTTASFVQAGTAVIPIPVPKPVDAPPKSASPASEAVSSGWHTMLSGMSPDHQKMMKRHVLIFKVPRGRRLVDHIAAVLKERLAPDAAKIEIDLMMRSYNERKKGSRTPEEPRGYTGAFRVGEDFHIFCFVGEENLTSPGDWDENGNRSRRSLVHSLGRAVFGTLSVYAHSDLKNLAVEYYKHDPEKKKIFQDGDEIELFAECTEIWFGVHQHGLNKKGWDTSEPFVHLAGMMRFNQRVYGPSRNVR